MIEKTEIKDVVIYTPTIYFDKRGYIFESYNKKTFELFNKIFSPIQDNESESTFGTLRGIHFQKPPFAQSKLIRVIHGKIQDVAVDLRPESNTYKKHISIILDDKNKKQLFIPRGFAHAFLVLSEKAIVTYKVDNFYNPDYDFGIKFDDPSLNIKWNLNLDKIILSDKDKNLPYL